MRLLLLVSLLLGSPLVAATPAAATIVSYVLSMDGSQEVPGPGDADGTASGTITLDDVTGAVSWNLTYANIDLPTAMHIHSGAAGVAGGVLIGLGVATSGGAGTLIDNLVAAPASVASVLAAPANFYVNIHNASFGPGAVRGQLGTLPEPGAALLLGAATVALALRSRR
jgi:hypothetical protein